MPTENRSSNTEQMVSVPRELLEQIHRFEWNGEGASDAGCTLSGILSGRITYAQPAAQHQGEPEAFRWENLGGSGWCYGENLPVILIGTWQELYLHPSTSDGFSAGDMADQGAKAFAARDGEVELLRVQLDRRNELLERMKAMFLHDDPHDLYDAVCSVLSDKS
ncbi:hypothetical protein [Pseudomonas tussilaginis]|uniref:hypothetical protein n=1 Tax=Pseudomonas putida TaxID=303 RepID=UPI0023634F10|nr:hypothetical protein [Pseudomonas putida]MDD1977155.1 hypothetical protein [Pseudomonas putida]